MKKTEKTREKKQRLKNIGKKADEKKEKNDKKGAPNSEETARKKWMAKKRKK